jgi:hypothetical protein
LAADYQLQNVFTSSVGTIGPLAVVGNPNDVTFTDDVDVDGNNQIVASIGENFENIADTGAGLQAQTAGFLSSDNYSVVLLADFNLAPDLAATKVFDFKNLSADPGLYINDLTGLLYFQGATDSNGITPATGGSPILTGNYAQIVLTRDSSTGLVSVYENGSPAFQFNDTGDLATLGDATNTGNAYLTVFKDDATGVGDSALDETSVGDVARLRLYDGVLTPAEVANLDTTVPEPVSGGLMLLGSAFLLRRSRREKLNPD